MADKPLIACAIDIGSTSSGCFFSSYSDFQSNPLQIYSVLNTSGVHIRQKEPSCFLLDEGMNVVSSGVEAQEQYAESVDEGCQDQYHFFEGFRTILYDRTNFKRNAKLKDSSGQFVDAITVFRSVLLFLKRRAEMVFKSYNSEIGDSDIVWILPVPVVWNRVALEFMKEAAEMAGIKPSHFSLVKEPDTAVMLSIYEFSYMELLEKRRQFMVLDCGGGKTDLTVYDVVKRHEIHEKHKANIAGVGGKKIHEFLWNILTELLGKKNVEYFRRDQIVEKDLIEELDKKVSTITKETSSIKLKLPVELLQMFLQKFPENENFPLKYQDKINIQGDKLRIQNPLIQEMFKGVCMDIEKYVDPLLRNQKLKHMDTAILVGGLSSSPMIQGLLKSKFKNILVPCDPELAVVKGAVLFGHKSAQLNVRREEVKHLIVAAIDFGTTFSGYAFSSISGYQTNPLEIMSFVWSDQNGKFSSNKTSTCVLFDPEGKLHSVGYDAEEKYSELADEDDNERINWFFFRRFKMNLYKQKTFNRDSVLLADNGKQMDALVVFSAVIRYLREHMKRVCDKRMAGILDSEIKWIITVPAIWSDSAKQFMREAAEKAGIDSHQLSLALEPEAASLFCRYSSIEKQGDEIIKMTSNTKYMVLDCGGGTVDITIHEVVGSKFIKEIYKANGGSWGGTTVDNAFWELLQEILGEDVLEDFRRECKYFEMEMINTFEIKKRHVDESTEKDIILTIPTVLEDTVKKRRRKTIAKVLESNEKYREKIKAGKGRLKISPDLFRSFFDYACTSIVRHLNKLLVSPKLSSVDTILMVGGFSESPILQHAVKKNFPNIRVLVPYNAGIAVLNGAVLCGHEPETVHSRICRFTYGVEIPLPFEDGIDQRRYLFKDKKGRTMCYKRFKVIVSEDEEVAIDSASASQLIEVEGRDQFHFILPVYVSDKGCPRYTTDCTKIGEVKIDSDDVWREDFRTFRVEMVFGYIESIVKVTDIKTKKSVTAKFDFLG